MRKLIKTITGADCEVYGIVHHERILPGKAMPQAARQCGVAEQPKAHGQKCSGGYYAADRFYL